MHFDWTITFGAIVVVAGFVCTTIWSTGKIVSKVTFAISEFNHRLDGHDEWIKMHDACSQLQIKALAAISKDLAYLRGVSDAKAQQVKTPPLQDRY